MLIICLTNFVWYLVLDAAPARDCLQEQTCDLLAMRGAVSTT